MDTIGLSTFVGKIGIVKQANVKTPMLPQKIITFKKSMTTKAKEFYN